MNAWTRALATNVLLFDTFVHDGNGNGNETVLYVSSYFLS